MNICLEAIMHALGEYPEEYAGKRFEVAPKILLSTHNHESSKSTIEGKIKELLPYEKIICTYAQSGHSGSIAWMGVEHKSGGQSVIHFLPFSQSVYAFHGFGRLDVVLFDTSVEKPSDEVYGTALLKTLASGGIIHPTHIAHPKGRRPDEPRTKE